MCGIYGFVGKIKKGKHQRVLKLIENLAVESEVRGIDATGFFSIGTKAILMEKNAIPAEQFIEESTSMKSSILDNNPHIWVGHNRQASVGNVDTISSHPFMGEKHLLVHNGTCREVKDMLTKKMIKKMKSTTDSEGILQLIEANGLKETLKEINAYSIVIANMENDKVWFARDYKRPMVIYDLRKQYGIRVFCSTKAIGEIAMTSMGLKYKAISVFSTKPFHLYSADFRDGEFKNEGRYHTPPVQEPETEVVYVYPDPTMTGTTTIAPAKKASPKKLWNRYFGQTKTEYLKKQMISYGD